MNAESKARELIRNNGRCDWKLENNVDPCINCFIGLKAGEYCDASLALQKSKQFLKKPKNKLGLLKILVMLFIPKDKVGGFKKTVQFFAGKDHKINNIFD